MVVVGTDEVGEVARWAEGIERVHQCIAGRFRRPEPRRRDLEYLKGFRLLAGFTLEANENTVRSQEC